MSVPAISKNLFRAVAVVSLTLAALGQVVAWYGERQFPAPLREYLEGQRLAEATPTDWVIVGIAVPLIIASIASFVGFLRFRPWARPFSVWLTLLGTGLLPLLGPTVEPASTTALNSASSVLYGALLALSYYSPAALWFEDAGPRPTAAAR